MPTALEITERIRYATPNDVYAGLKGGGSIAVEEYAGGEIATAAELAGKREHGADDASIVISLCIDGDQARMNTIWMHPDEDARLELIDRARMALDDAEAALLAVGYVDNAHVRQTNYMPTPRREHNAFRLGVDSARNAD